MNVEIRKFISDLGEYMARSRRAGHTTLLLKGAMEYDRPFYVVAMNMKYATQLARDTQNPNAIPTSISTFDTSTRSTLYPVILDNSVLIEFINSPERSNLELESLQPYIEQLRELRLDFKNEIEEVETNWYLGLPNS